MEPEISVDGNTVLLTTHFFIYKGKRYPFNMKLLKCFSQYFQTNKNLYKNTTEIDLIDDSEDKIALIESAISDFISFCHSQKITIRKENALSLNILAKKYVVPILIESTNKFISTHQKDVVIDLLIINQDIKEFSTEEYEETISKDFQNYANDDRLLCLRIPIIYRILKKTYQHIKMSESRDKCDQIITEFLFKCLDHFGRPASVLFSLATCNDFKQIDLSRLRKDYSEKFDFHFLSEELVSHFYREESDNLGKAFQLIEEIERMKAEQEEMRGEIEKLKKREEEKTREREEENQQLKQDDEEKLKEINQLKEEIRKLIEEQEKMSHEIHQLRQMNENMKKEKETESERKEKEIKQIKQDEEERISRIRSDFSNQIKDLTEKLTEVKAKQEEKPKMLPSIRALFSGSSNRNGLISRLGDGVTLSATGNLNSSYPVTNIKSYDVKYFYNSYSKNPTTESESIIKFDFGSSRRVDLYSYFIRSNSFGPNSQHPKSWRIEGSNDDRLWTILDRRLNDEHLRGEYKEHHFECQESRHIDEHRRFRYIRYVQVDSWCDNYPYCVCLTYFELYGDVYNI